MTLGDFDGSVGDFEVVETSDGSDEFILKVATSGAPNLGASQSISVDLTYTNADGEDLTSTLMGTITERADLGVADSFTFTIPQNVAPDTPIGSFDVTNALPNESLDGIITGDEASPFAVNDADMTIYRKNGADLVVGDYEFDLTVNGDAGLAARVVRADVIVRVSASNSGHTVPATFAKTIAENLSEAGLVDGGTVVGDASDGVSNPDDDTLTYEIVQDDTPFVINGASGEVTVGDDGIGDTTDLVYNFDIKVSDGVTANDKTIAATVTVVANERVTAKTGDVGDVEAVDGSPGSFTFDSPQLAGTLGNPVTLFSFANLVDGAADENDVPSYEIISIDALAPLALDSETGALQVTHIPESIKTTLSGTWSVTVGVNDGYNMSDNGGAGASNVPPEYDDDTTITVAVTINVQPAPNRLFPNVTVSVDEETPAYGSTSEILGAVADQAGTHPALADLIDNIGSDAMTYTHISGANAGAVVAGEDNAFFSVDSETGAVTMMQSISYEDIVSVSGVVQNPSLNIEVKRDSDAANLGFITLNVRVNDVNEMPMFDVNTPSSLGVEENAQPGTNVGSSAIMASDPDDGDNISFSIKESGTPFAIDSAGGQITVSGALDLDDSPYSVTLVATDDGTPTMSAEHALSITVGDVNDPPRFDQPATTTASIPENTAAGTVVATYNATDADAPDNDTIEGIHYELRDADDLKNFDIMTETVGGQIIGKLVVKEGANLDVDAAGAATSYTVEVNVKDADDADSELVIEISITDVNDNAPMFSMENVTVTSIRENDPRGTAIGRYIATDGDSTAPNNEVTYSIDHKSFHIDSSTGMLTVLESLDFESGTPCTTCVFKVTATDGGDPTMTDTLDVTLIVQNAEDSVSTFKVSKANPVPGVSMGNPDSALADTKTGMYGIPERPSDQPATEGSAPDNFVEADWANWGTVLRVAVTSQSPNADCGVAVANQNNNQCVYIDVESDSAGNELRLAAYRSATQENLFIAAVMVVEKDPTDDGDDKDGDRNNPVYKDASGGVVRLEADEEDEISFRLVGSTAPPIKVDVENEDPEFNNFMPEHEAAFDDGDVEYTFTITDPVSGIPEPEDLAGDNDGDSDYMPLVAIISDSQCHSENPNDKAYSMHNFAGNSLWCKSAPEIRQVVDDRDFDEIDEGFEVATEIVLPTNEAHYVTFIVCDNAGNCAMYTPDENDTDEALAEITIDDQDPDLIEARTGIKWDATDSEYDDDSTFIQLLFNDLTALDPTSIEADDFVVEGHTIKDVHWYDVSDTDDDTAWGDDDDSTTPSRFAMGGSNTLRGHPLRQSIRNAVFIELEDELAPDETPDVTIVPNGILDAAGNEQDDDEVEADDWIAPSFTVVSIVSPRTPEGSSNQLAGDGDEVMIRLTSDERIQQTRPLITVTYVNAPAGCVNTANKQDDSNKDGYNPYDRGQIKTNKTDEDCGSSATGGTLGTTFERVSNTEWVVTVDEPDDTGYYNIHISGNDRSEQRNKGSEGVAAGDIAKKFFERDGDVNTDDAHFFQGDINLSNPGVRVSGVQIEDTEPTVEFKSPLFVELDFTKPYISDCGSDLDKDERDANCYAESDEYAKDSFDSVTVTSFTLNGTDITESVKTTDNETFLVSIEGIDIGDHEIEIQAMDQAGNTLDKALSVEFEVEERDDFTKRLSPGWNLVSIPGEPADSDISVVFGSDVEVRTIYTYDPVIPGGWMVAVRETLDSEWQGDLMDITARRGYWVLSDAIQDWDVSIPRIAGGAVGTGTPIQPPVIALYAGWNLVPVIDVTGNFDGDGISAQTYLQSLDDGLDLARVLGFDTITNSWSTVMAPESGASGTLDYGKAYWVFVRQAGSLVPGGD